MERLETIRANGEKARLFGEEWTRFARTVRIPRAVMLEHRSVGGGSIAERAMEMVGRGLNSTVHNTRSEKIFQFSSERKPSEAGRVVLDYNPKPRRLSIQVELSKVGARAYGEHFPSPMWVRTYDPATEMSHYMWGMEMSPEMVNLAAQWRTARNAEMRDFEYYEKKHALKHPAKKPLPKKK